MIEYLIRRRYAKALTELYFSSVYHIIIAALVISYIGWA